MKPSQLLFSALGRRLPIVDGELGVVGLRGSVSIRRDEFGVPHIDAGTDYDAWFALGFCQGQDRSFQLELIARSVRGTLSEIFGSEGLPIDRLNRRLGLKRRAEVQLTLLDEDVREMVTAFANGVNAGRELGCSRQAHEFSVLRATPSEWNAADCLGYLKFTSLLMSTNWAEELARFEILNNDGIDSLAALEPEVASHLPVTNPPGIEAIEAAADVLEEARTLARELGIEFSGSNNWAVSGSRTKSGHPILANDTHLSPALPTHFYLAHITTPNWSVAGGSYAGFPGFFLGHNGVAAWGVTIGYLDNTDLFIEELGQDSSSVREGDAFVPCEVREERITVKGSNDIIERVLTTGRGPVIRPPETGERTAISMSATWLKDLPLKSLSSAHRWQSFTDLQTDLAHHPNVSLNVVYADVHGDIGWKLAGSLPNRAGSGAVPLSAANPDNHWKPGLRPPDERLTARNPACGYIATANNRPTADAVQAGFSADWPDGYRVARIHERLSERFDWEPEDMWQMQLDTDSIPWRDLKPIIERIRPVDDDSRAARLMILRWDGSVNAGSTSAALFELFIATVSKKVAERAAPNSFDAVLNRGGSSSPRPNYSVFLQVSNVIGLLQKQPRGWFERGWNSVLADSLGDALRLIRARYGDHTRHWNWGSVRPLYLTHQLGRGPLRGIFNRGPYPVGGDSNTIHAAGVNPLAPLDAGVRSIATARTVIEIGDWDNARFVLLGGQSGNPLSPHYDDQVPIWLEGKGVPIAWNPGAVEIATHNTLYLLPDS